MAEDSPEQPQAPIQEGVGFRVVTDILFKPHPNFAALNVDEKSLREDMAKAFLEVLQARVPETAEANGYVVQELRTGVDVVVFEPTSEPATHDAKSAQDHP